MEYNTSNQVTEHYAIIGMEYKYFVSVKEQRLAAIEELNRKLDKIRNVNREYFKPQNVLILWTNNPEENFLRKKLGHSNDQLIMQFCDRIKRAKRKKAVQLFIDRPQTLFEDDKSIFIILERLVKIWEDTEIIPIFLQDDFLSIDDKGLLGREGWMEEWNEAVSFVDALKISHMAKDKAKQEQEESFQTVKSYYEHFYKSIKTLIGLLKPKENIKIEVSEKSKTDFIRAYFMWQSGIYVSVEKVLEAFDEEIPVSTWYRYTNKFEENIVYEEYTVAYWNYLCIEDDDIKEQNISFKKDGYVYRPKKGACPDPVAYICFLNREERLSFFDSSYEVKNPYFFKGINSIIDVERVKVTSKIQIRHLWQRKSSNNQVDSNNHYGKNLIKEKLKKYKYETSDLYSIFSKKSPYYNDAQALAYNFSEIDSFIDDIEMEQETPEEQEWLEFLAGYDGK